MEYRGGERDEIRKPLHMPEGELVFPIYSQDTKVTRLVWFDLEKSAVKTLAHFETEPIKQLYGIQDKEVYYESFEGIVKWNILSGERKRIYDFEENGVGKTFSTMLILREEKPPLLRMYGTVHNELEDWLVVLTEERVERHEAVQVVNLNGNSTNVQTSVAVATRKNPEYDYVYQNYTTEEMDDFRTRILADMVAGKGPDILYVSLEDMQIMQEKGMLLQLNELLSQEAFEQILPGIIEMGTINGEFVGLAPEMETFSAVTLKNIWDKESWSLGDIVKLAESGKYAEIFCQGNTSFAARALLVRFTEAGLQNEFVDWNEEASCFDGDAFLDVLRMAKPMVIYPSVQILIWVWERVWG